MANVSSSNTTTLYSTTQTTPIQQGAPVTTGQVNDANFTTLYTAGQQVSPNNNFVVPGTLTVNGCAILTNCPTFNILPTTATTVNLGGAATSVNIGAATGVTLINNQLATANYAFPIADGTVDQVLTTDGNGNIYWALPGGGGSQFGNITIGVTTDNTIDTTTGDLFLTSDTGSVIVEGDLEIDNSLTINADQSGNATITAYGGSTTSTITWDGTLWNINEGARITNTSAITNAGVNVLRLRADSTGNPQVGFGSSLAYEVESSPGNYELAGFIDVKSEALAPNPDFRMGFGLMQDGAAYEYKLIIDSSADLEVLGDPISTTPVGIGGLVANNDFWHIGGYSISGTGSDGALEIATANEGSEPIYVRQYSGGLNIGDAWPWGNSPIRTLTLLDASGNTDVPNTLTVGGDVLIDGNLTINADQTVGTSTITAYSGSNANTITYTTGIWTINNFTRINNPTATTNAVISALSLRNDSTGTAALGMGTALTYEVEVPSGSFITAGSIGLQSTDVTVGAEQFRMNFSLTDTTGNLNTKAQLYSDGNLVFVNNSTATAIGVGGIMAGNDYWHIGGYSIAGSGANDGALEIATANNGNEPIYVRQYSGAAVAGNTWPYGNTVLRTLTLLDASGNTALPGTLTLTGSTSGSTTFSVPATGSTLTYVLPSTAGAANTVLTNDGSGNLSWALPGGGGSTFGNVSIGVVTDNTISTTSGDLDITSATGVVNIDTYTTLTDNRLTTTSTSTVTLDSFAVATYQNATYFINVKDNVTGDIQSTKVDIMHNGTTAYINQYANMYTTADLSTFAATISGANVLLEITPASANSTQFTFSRTALKV